MKAINTILPADETRVSGNSRNIFIYKLSGRLAVRAGTPRSVPVTSVDGYTGRHVRGAEEMCRRRARRRIVLVFGATRFVGGVFKGRACVAPATLRLKSHDVSKKGRDVGKWAIIAINSRNERSSFLFGLSR